VGVDVDLEQGAHAAHAGTPPGRLFESLEGGAQLVALVAVEAESHAARVAQRLVGQAAGDKDLVGLVPVPRGASP
jgi:hypothetical protein